METIKTCAIHEGTVRVLKPDGRYRCLKCGVAAVQKRRRKLKLMAIEYKGGKCVKCGYSKSVYSLVFHHQDSAEKDFGISHKGYTRSWKKVKIELDKCDLLCTNCHGEEHEKIDKNGLFA